MTKVIKKLGHRQDFDLNKIRRALINTAKDIDLKFTKEDWKELKPRICSRLEPLLKKEEIYFWHIDEVVEDALLRSRFNELTKQYIKSRAESKKDTLNDIGVSPAAMYVLKDRYLRKDNENKPIETVKEMLCRVATDIASAEKSKELREEYTEKFSDMLINRDFLPNSPALVAAGSKNRGTYSACFAYGIEDSLDDILRTVHKTAKTFQYGGGVGVSIAKLREKGAPIKTTNGRSSGSVEFLNIFDIMCSTIKTGGFRRGALMCLTEYNHPDIEWFIKCKNDTQKLNNMNISVLVDDKFIDAIKKDETIPLISPQTKEKVDEISGKLLLEQIAHNIWLTGEPGILFYDRMNKDNPTPHLGDLRLTNPCLTSDSWVFSSYGPRQIRDLTDIEETHLLNNGEMYKSNSFFSTGIKDVFEICTNRGYKIKATPNHLISTYTVHDRYTKIKDWKRVDELQEGDIIELSNNRDNKEWLTFGQEWQGYLLGQIVSDGYIEKNRERANIKLWEADKGYEGVKAYIESILHNLNTKSDFKGFRKYKETYNLGCKQLYDMCKDYGISINKQLTPTIEKTSSKFYKGFLSGMFDGDGTVLINKEKGSSIRLGQNNLKRLETIQRMLSRLGIVSTIYKNRHDEGLYPMPDGNGGLKEYFRKAMHELVISKDNMALFQQLIGFKNTNKKKRLESILKSYDRNIYKENFITYVTDIKYVGKEEVFDTNVEEVHSFDANGIIVHNCSESNLLNNEACNLGSINLVNHMTEDKKDLDWDKFAETIKLSVRFLDDMIDASPYPAKEVEEAVKDTRKIGVGVMGFHDMLIHMGIKYSSKKALKVAGRVMSFLTDVASQESKKLGEEKGIYKEYKDGYPKRRNAIVTIQAPTGTLSLIAGVSPGIEPNFYKAYSRKIVDSNEMVRIEHPLADDENFEIASEISPEQHLKMLSEIQKHVENSVSKCVAKGTYITTNKGIYQIEDIIDRQGKLVEDKFYKPFDSDLETVNHKGDYVNIKSIYYNGIKPTKKIHFNNGDTLEGTYNHRVMTNNGWKKLKELSIGDYVKCRLDCQPTHINPHKLPKPIEYKVNNPTYNSINIPEYMNDDLSKLLGMIVADGSTTKSSGHVGITTADDHVELLFKHLSYKLFGVEPKVTYDKRTENTRDVYITSKKLCMWIESLIGKGCRNKYVPEQIMHGNTSIKISFIEGVTLDGYIKKRDNRNELCIYEGYSKKLANQLYTMCCSIGLSPYKGIKKVNKDNYTYSVIIHTITKNGNVIKPIEKHKQIPTTDKVKIIDIPDSAKKLKTKDYRPNTHLHSLVRYINEKDLNVIKTNTLDDLGIDYKDNVYYVRVTDIENSSSEVYDLEIDDDSHTYVINNVITHNTINAPEETTVEDIKRLILMGHELNIKGLTIFRENCNRDSLIKCEDCKI